MTVRSQPPGDLTSRTRAWAKVRAEAFGRDLRQHGWTTEAQITRAVAWLAPKEGGILLDVGCGEGLIASRMAKLADCKIVGLDLTEPTVSVADPDFVTLLRADASTYLPFRDAAFDGLTCIDTLPHLPDLDHALRHWRRTLRPGARLVITDPVIISGRVSNADLAVRTQGAVYHLSTVDLILRSIRSAGLVAGDILDDTAEMVDAAERWDVAMGIHHDELEAAGEGATVLHQRRFCNVIAALGASGGLKRITILAEARAI